ncbi:MAG: aryl-sulfate sulfotransferase [Deltaproteobacteria bacterium]|nr:aryl-sulfate sulfotransferase [Deltaproteobacteria bacterium]
MRWFVLLLLACNGKDSDTAGDAGADTDDTDGSTVAPGLIATVAPSPFVPAVGLVTFAGAGTASVEYGLAGAFDHVTPTVDGSAHTIAMIGLKAGQSYSWRAVVVDAAGQRLESAPGTFVVPAAPVPALTVSAGDASAFAGSVMVSVIDRAVAKSWLAFADSDGDWVWWVETLGNGIINAEFGNDGKSVVYGEYNNDEAIDSGHLVRVSMDGTTRTETRVLRGHHDFSEQPDGEFAFVSMEFATVPMEGTPEPVKFGADTIRKGPEGMGDSDVPPIVFDTFEYTGAEPSFVCSHVEPTLTNFGIKLGESAVLEWTHGNSLVYLPAQNAWYLNARYTDWLLKIDATSGQVLWELNGTGTRGSFTNGVLWSHSHLSDVWDGGALVFDNGDHHVPQDSRIVQVSWDEVEMTAGIDFEIEGPPGFASAIGDARRMPDGRVLGAWGNLGEVTIHSGDGAVLDWQAGLGSPRFAARARYADDLYVLPDED